VSRAAPIGALGPLVLETAEIDRSWCHTIGYLSPILAGVAVGAALTGESRDADPVVIRALLAEGVDQAPQAESIATALAGCRELIVVASGADLPAGRELALKVEEATWLPTALRDTETFLHGHLPAMDAATGLVLVLADRAGRESRSARAQQALAAAARVGMRPAAIIAGDLDAEWPTFLAPAGRILAAEAPTLPSPVAALVGTVMPLQLLTERLARVRGTNPDSIRRDELAYREAASLAD
jgi:fructoselysine-6-P-deglycase FrlB-like protein